MTGTPQIDDRRRFKDTVRELLYARVMVGGLSGAVALALYVLLAAALGGVMWSSQWVIGNQNNKAAWLQFFLTWFLWGFNWTVIPLALAAPTAVAKRGRMIFPLAVLVVLGSSIVALLPGYLVESEAMWGISTCLAGAALGLTEGRLERSLATLYAGMLGGAATGAIVGQVYMAEITSAWGNTLDLTDALAFITLCAGGLMCMTLHLGIGLSLALGRWIRDLPKRKAEEGEPTE